VTPLVKTSLLHRIQPCTLLECLSLSTWTRQSPTFGPGTDCPAALGDSASLEAGEGEEAEARREIRPREGEEAGERGSASSSCCRGRKTLKEQTQVS
jgi:hypothetical protein